MSENWKPVVGFEDYEISDIGNVRRTDTKAAIVPVNVDKSVRSLRVTLRKNGRTSKKRVHRMVLEAFVGPCPPGMEARHLDDNAGNNKLENLAWKPRKFSFGAM